MPDPTWPGHRPYGDPISTYVDPDELQSLREKHGMLAARRIVRRDAALRIVEAKAQAPDADRDLLAVLHYLITS